MKKIALCISAIFATLSLSACGGGVPQSDYDKVVKERDELKAQVSALQSTSSTSSTEESKSSDDAKEPVKDGSSGIGSRKNAAKIGDVVTGEVESFSYGHAELEITLNSIIRGQEAADLIAKANQFNDPAPEGKEYIIAEFTFKNLKDLSDEDTAFRVVDAQFSFSNSGFAKESQLTSVVIDNELDMEIFENAETTGNVVFLADKDDACYAIYCDNAWFSLSK